MELQEFHIFSFDRTEFPQYNIEMCHKNKCEFFNTKMIKPIAFVKYILYNNNEYYYI